MAKLVIMLRVKDGIFFVKEWLERYEKLADEIVVLDNGSTDGTCEILEAHPKVVDLIRTEGYNEGRDKNLLYARMRLRQPDWCLWVDMDEIFEPAVTRARLNQMMQSKYITKYTFRRFHFIDREYFAGSLFYLNYSAGHDRMMWREQASGYFEDKILDSPNVKGITGMKMPTHYRLKHLGYISKELVDIKAAIYRTVISAEKAGNIQTMYLHNERKRKWHDKRTHPSVILLNGFLNCLLLRQYFFKALEKVTSTVRQPKTAQQG